MTANTEQERAILYKGFCEWCKTVPHLDLDPRLHTHGGRIEDGGYISDTATAKAFAAWKAARRAPVGAVPQGYVLVPVEPTDAMYQRVFDEGYYHDDPAIAKAVLRSEYQNMLAAAPAQEQA